MVKRKVLVVLAVLLLTSLFSVYAGGKSEAKAQDEGKIRLTFLSHTYEPWNVKLQEQADAFMKLNPNVVIEYSTVMHEDLYTKLMTSAQAGTAADIIGVYGPWMQQLVNSNFIAPAPADVEKDVAENLTRFGKEGVTFDGKVYGYIQHIGILAPIVNPDFFKEIGAPIPKTWTEYGKLADRLAGRDDITVTALAPSGAHIVLHYATLLRAFGGQLLTPDVKKAAFNTPEGLAALKTYLKLSDPRFPENDANSVFILGKAGMVLDGAWAQSFYKQAGIVENFYTTVPPTEKEQWIAAYVWNWVVNANSSPEKQRAAWDFIKFISNDENYLDMATSIGFAPFRVNNIEELEKDAWVKGFTDALDYGFIYYPRIENWEEIERLIARELERAVAGEISAEQALSNAQTAVDNAL
jgi:ABC-type glycerol-3-phosphate transport system substrate-binding protein